MRAETEEGFTMSDLEIQRLALEDRIKRLNEALKAAAEDNLREESGQVSTQMILKRLLEVERNNLRKVNFELEKKKQGTF